MPGLGEKGKYFGYKSEILLETLAKGRSRRRTYLIWANLEKFTMLEGTPQNGHL